MGDSDRRLTPDWVVEAVRVFAGGTIGLDVCTEPENPLGAIRYYAAPDNDGLTGSWALPDGGVGWMNPPFSNILPWAQKWAVQDGTWLAFSPVDYSAGWWRVFDQSATARVELARRPKCVDPETGRTMDVARCAALWCRADDVQVRRFQRIFCSLGRVVVLNHG